MKQQQKQKLRQLEQALAEATTPTIPQNPHRILHKNPRLHTYHIPARPHPKIPNQPVHSRPMVPPKRKSQTVAALLLHYALTNPNTQIGIVGPSWRQTKLVIKRINTFLKKLPKGTYHKLQHTVVRLKTAPP